MIQLDTSWLQHVQKPARYTGGEYNSIVKDHSTVDVTMALAFPDVYEVAMSHLGIKILYGLVNRREDAAAERVFAPWHDMEEEMRKRNIPLFSLETRTPIKDFDVLAFTLQYEMSFTNILNMLDLAGIPMYAKDRDMDFPLLVCGGPCAFNVEPIADFFDIVSLGESEEWGDEFIDLYKAEKAKGFPGGKEAFLRKVAQIPGTYCPALYDVEYTEQGDFKSITPRFEEVPAAIQKRIVEDVEHIFFPTKPIVPFLDVVHDRAVLELFRGCTRGCRFCQAGIAYRPLFAYGMVGICAPDHPLAAKEIWQAEDFAGETLITYPVPDDMLDLLRKILLPRGINPQRRHSELTIAIVQLVASRRGIAALPYWTVMPYLEKGYVVSCKITENGLQSELYAAMRSEDGDTGYLADFCQIVRDQGFATLPGLSILE